MAVGEEPPQRGLVTVTGTAPQTGPELDRGPRLQGESGRGVFSATPLRRTISAVARQPRSGARGSFWG